ncbi:MAG: hypothetical protein M3Y53_04080 [Thermoproteota archaeon]|nr:hypothetical protein [Thermoproteota archaeon]
MTLNPGQAVPTTKEQGVANEKTRSSDNNRLSGQTEGKGNHLRLLIEWTTSSL